MEQGFLAEYDAVLIHSAIRGLIHMWLVWRSFSVTIDYEKYYRECSPIECVHTESRNPELVDVC